MLTYYQDLSDNGNCQIKSNGKEETISAYPDVSYRVIDREKASKINRHKRTLFSYFSARSLTYSKFDISKTMQYHPDILLCT